MEEDDPWGAAAGESASVRSPKPAGGMNLAGFLPVEARSSVHLRKIEAAFEAADRDGSGLIDRDEFEKVFGLGKRLSSAPYAKVLFGVFDIDGSGGIDFREFVFGMNHFPMPESPGAFEKFLFTCFVSMDKCPKEALRVTVGESMQLLKPLKSMTKEDFKEQRGELMSMLTTLQSEETPVQLSREEFADLLGAYQRAMAPAQYIWKSISRHVGACKTLHREIMEKMPNAEVFADLDRAWRLRTRPGVNIEAATALARRKGKGEGGPSFAQAGKGVLAAVRMAKLTGGKVSFPPAKREAVYKVKAPHFIQDESGAYRNGSVRRGGLSAEESPARARAATRRTAASAETMHRGSPRTVLPDIGGGSSSAGSVFSGGRPKAGGVHAGGGQVSFNLPEPGPERPRFERGKSKSWHEDRRPRTEDEGGGWSPDPGGRGKNGKALAGGGSGGGLVSRAKGFLAKLS